MTFDGLQPQSYRVILADPPWTFAARSDKGEGRSAKQHYETMSLAALKALPVQTLAAKDCVLFLWATDTHLDVAFDVIKAWGFTFKTVGFYWTKDNADGSAFTGMGYWTRANPEQCLLATRGSPKRVNADVPRLIRAKRRQHSRKPDETHERIERLVEGPYLELFARQERPGWTAWGHQTDRFPAERTIMETIYELHFPELHLRNPVRDTEQGDSA